MTSFFNNKINALILTYNKCQNKNFEWIYVTKYINDKRNYLYINKKIINLNDILVNRNILFIKLPDYDINNNKYKYQNKTYTTVYYDSKNTQSHYCFLIFDENYVEKIQGNNIDFWFNKNTSNDFFFKDDKRNNTNIKEIGWIYFRYYMKKYSSEKEIGTITFVSSADTDTLKISENSIFFNLLQEIGMDKFNHPDISGGPFGTKSNKYINFYKELYYIKDNKNDYVLEKNINKFIDLFKTLSVWREDNNNDDIVNIKSKWLTVENNKHGVKYNINVFPSFKNINQKQLQINSINSTNYINQNIMNVNNNEKNFYYNEDISKNFIKVLPNVIPLEDLILKIKINKVNNDDMYHPNISIRNVNKSNDEYKISIKKNSKESTNDILSEFLKTIVFDNSEETYKYGSFIKVNWTIESKDLLFDKISSFFYIGILSVRFRLNFSGSSILTNLNNNNNIISNAPKKNDTLGGGYNSIIMNKDSDFDYLIVESLPFNNVFHDTVNITINSSDENVFTSTTYKNILLSNTDEKIRLQRLGDPRDYFLLDNLIKLNCNGGGITLLTFNIKSENPLLNNLKISPIKLIAINIKFNLNTRINLSKGPIKADIVLEPINICKSLFSNDINLWKPKGKRFEIDDSKIFNKITNNYLDNYLYLNNDNDISLNNIKYDINEIKKGLNFEIHFATNKNNSDGEIFDINPVNVNSYEKSFYIYGKKSGKLSLFMLVNSHQLLSKFLKNNLTFNNVFNEFPSLENKDNNPLFNLWPAKLINNKTFLYKNGIDDIDHTYKFVSNGGPNLLSCGVNNEYGWIENNQNIHFTKKNLIENVEIYIKNNIDNSSNDVCNILFGKKTFDKINKKYIFNRNFWAEKDYDIDFYAEAVLNPTKQRIENKETFIVYSNNIIKNNFRSINMLFFERPKLTELNYNEIKQYYIEQDRLFTICHPGNYWFDKKMNGTDIKVNNKIKLVLSNPLTQNTLYYNKIFVVEHVYINVIKPSYILKLKPLIESNYTSFDLNLDKKMEYNANKTDIYWIKDNTDDLQKSKIKEIESDYKNFSLLYNNFTTDYYDNIKNITKKLDLSLNNFNDNIGNINFILDFYEIRNMRYFFNQYIDLAIKLQDNIFEVINNKYKTLNSDYIELLEYVKENKYYNENDINKKINENKNKLIEIVNLKFNYTNINIKQENITIKELYTIFIDNLNEDVVTQFLFIQNKIQEKFKIEQEILKDKSDFVYNIKDKQIKWYEFKDINLTQGVKVPKITINSKFRHNILLYSEFINDNGIMHKSNLFNTKTNKIVDIDKFIKSQPLRVEGGNSGIFFGNYDKNNNWIYTWREWDVKFYAENVPVDNYNIINKYKKEFGNRLLLFCKGFKYLTKTFDKYDLLNSKIKLFNFDNIYDENTIFFVNSIDVISLKNDTYNIVITPSENINLKIEIKNYDFLDSYWEIQIPPETPPMDPFLINCEITTNVVKPTENRTVWIPSVILKSPIGKLNYPIKWASTKNRKIVIEPFLFKDNIVKLQTENSNYSIKLWSQIKNIKLGTHENYYLNNNFPSLPKAKMGISSFGIYTGGHSDSIYKNNFVPKKDLWFQSKILPINFTIIKYPPPILNDYKIGNSNNRLDIFWSMDVEDKVQGKSVFKVLKYDNDTGLWNVQKLEGINNEKKQQFTDFNVVSFKTYSYKVIASTDYFGKKETSLESNILNVFICANNKFPNGRYNPTVIKKKCYDGTIDVKIYRNDNKLTKKQIYAKLANKKSSTLKR